MVVVIAQEAIDFLKSDTPVTIVFTDVVMPGGMTGYELAVRWDRLLREFARRSNQVWTKQYKVHRSHHFPSEVDLIANPEIHSSGLNTRSLSISKFNSTV